MMSIKYLYEIGRDTIFAYIADEALTRGAAIAFYTVTSLSPVLLIIVAIAGIVFGQQAAQGAVVAQLSGLMGSESATLVQSALQSASALSSGLVAGAIGIIALLITASGVFVEMQTALNVIWGVPEPQTDPVTRIVRARATSLGLVAALGFMLLVSLLVSAALTALGGWLEGAVPFGEIVLRIINIHALKLLRRIKTCLKPDHLCFGIGIGAKIAAFGEVPNVLGKCLPLGNCFVWHTKNFLEP